MIKRILDFKFTNARLRGPVIDQWNGEYIQVVEYKKRARPTVTVSVGGFTSEPVHCRPRDGSCGKGVPAAVGLLCVLHFFGVFRRRRFRRHP